MLQLANGKQQFLDQNGAPLAGGLVYHYAPGTTNPVTTYKDQAGQTANTNPIQLDSRGQAVIWGTGTIRQVVKDAGNTLIWDQLVNAPDVNAPANSLAAQILSSLGASMMGFIQGGIGAVKRTVQDKLRDTPNVLDFGAAGNGATDDTAALANFEASVAGRLVDLTGKTYKVASVPKANRYINGRWAVAKTTTINGLADAYTYYAPAVGDGGDAGVVSPVALARTGLSSIYASYARPDNHQGLAVDDVSSNTYILHVDTTTTPETSYVSQYAKAGGAVLAKSTASAQLGHQGLALEQNQSSAIRLWGSMRYDAAAYPLAHRQVMRFRFGGDAADFTSIETYTLFGPEYAYTGNAVMPSISYDQKYLVAVGRKDSRDFWVRVFALKDLQDGGPGDYSNRWIYEWQIDREILADDGGDSTLHIASAYTPLQAVACDAGAVYLIAGNSNLTAKRLHVYSIQGARQSSNDRMSVGLTEAKAVSGGTEFEPEALVFMRPAADRLPVLAVSVQYGIHGTLTTSLFALGYVPPAGRWTPTLTQVVGNYQNLGSYSCHYSRIGNIVTFAGRVLIDLGAPGPATFEMSPPFPSTFTSITDVAGTFASAMVNEGGAIEANKDTGRFSFTYQGTAVTSDSFYFSGMYEVK